MSILRQYMAQIIIEIIEEKGDFYDILLKKTL